MQLRELGPPPTILPPNYDANARCGFHFGAPSHSVENCKALKYKVQEMTESKAITFAPNGPNVNNNHMPPHNKPTVKMMEEEEGKNLVSSVDKLKTLLINIKEQLLMNNLSFIYNASCERSLINPQTCEDLKTSIQGLMN